MEYEFSASLGNTTCHIRSFKNHTVPKELVNDRPHKHYFIEFHGVFAGSEIVILPTENREIRLTPGQILLLPSGVYHGVVTRDEVVERLCFNFHAECEKGATSQILEFFQNIREVVVFENHTAMEMLERCRRLRQEQNSSLTEVHQGMLLLSIVLELFGSLPSQHITPRIQSSKAQQQKWLIEEYIERHFADNGGLGDLARNLYLSERQTRSLVRQFLGDDFKKIILRRRMELAEIYLHDPQKPMEEISRQVGYTSYSGFNLAFKRHFGITPREYRKTIAK